MPDRLAGTMPGTLGRILEIASLDARFRFRRTSGIVLMLVVAAGVYFIVPDLKSGFTLMQIGGQRVYYNSAAVALGTAIFCGVLLMMFGFYLVSNAVRRDIIARTGFVIAATPVSNLEFVAAKALGNVAYLAAIAVVCMLSSMVMFLLRGEAALEPWTFVATYLWLVAPPVMFCSALAILFEAIPFLAGRLGDVIYFFAWATTLTIPAILLERGNIPFWARGLDYVGIVNVIEQVTGQFHTNAVSIGATGFNAALPPILYPGLSWSWEMVLSRFLTVVLPVACVISAGAVFHRFNPGRIKNVGRQSRRNPIAWLNRRLKWVTRPLAAGGLNLFPAGSMAASVEADLRTTLLLSPLTLLLLLASIVLSLALNVDDLLRGYLPALVAVAIVAVAEVVTRDRVTGIAGLLWSAPKLKASYVAWKLLSVLMLLAGFMLIPFVRLVGLKGTAAFSLASGSFFVGCAAVSFGVLTRSSKAFMAIFLMLLYIALNARTEPVVDFAGFNGCATPGVILAYAAIGLGLLMATESVYRLRLRRE